MLGKMIFWLKGKLFKPKLTEISFKVNKTLVVKKPQANVKINLKDNLNDR